MNAKMYFAKIEVPYSEALHKSFAPEEKKSPRFEYRLKKEGKKLVFTIDAKDSVALRAAMNSITKLITVDEKAEGVSK